MIPFCMCGSLRFGSSVEATYGFYITATSSPYLLSQKKLLHRRLAGF